MKNITKGCLLFCCLLIVSCGDNDDLSCSTSSGDDVSALPVIELSEHFQVAFKGKLTVKANITSCGINAVEWKLLSGRPLEIMQSSNTEILLNAPDVSRTELSRFSLTVTDSKQQTSTAEFEVSVHPYLLSTAVKKLDIIPEAEQSNSFYFLAIGNVDEEPAKEIFVNQNFSGDSSIQGKISILKVDQNLAVQREINVENGSFGTLGDFLGNGYDQLIISNTEVENSSTAFLNMYSLTMF